MRSKLRLSVNHLPTIRENMEATFVPNVRADSGSGTGPSHSIDDYVTSICQLAQPTSLGTSGTRAHHSSLHKSHKRAKLQPPSPLRCHSSRATEVCPVGKSCPQRQTAQAGSRDTSFHQSKVVHERAVGTCCPPIKDSAKDRLCMIVSLQLSMGTDPLDWLYGQHGKENRAENGLLHKRVANPADHKQSGVGTSRLRCPPIAGNQRGASSSGGVSQPQASGTLRLANVPEAPGKRSRTQRLQRRAGRGRSTLAQRPLLPVIYEL
ncbi:protein DEPP1 [Lissotriton helveticus]